MIHENKEETGKYIELQERFAYELKRKDTEETSIKNKMKEEHEKLKREFERLLSENESLKSKKYEMAENLVGQERKVIGKFILKNLYF